MLRTEFLGRNIGIEDEEGDRFDANDYGFSTGLFYGLTDNTTLSIRHDWVSALDELELARLLGPHLELQIGIRGYRRLNVHFEHGLAVELRGEVVDDLEGVGCAKRGRRAGEKR